MSQVSEAAVGTRSPAIKMIRKRWRILVTGAILVTVGLVAVIAAQSAFRSMTDTSALSQTQFDGVATGGQAEVVVEITSMPSNTLLIATLVQADSNSAYRRTSESLTITLSPGTNIVMGQASDVKLGAVLQIRGQRADAHSFNAQRIVILTGFVSVQ